MFGYELSKSYGCVFTNGHFFMPKSRDFFVKRNTLIYNPIMAMLSHAFC